MGLQQSLQLVEQTGLPAQDLVPLPIQFRSLCFTIHGWPSTTDVSIIRSEMVSWWFLESRRGMVALVMRPNLWPLRELATSGHETSTRGMPQRVAAPPSMKLSSAPESNKVDVLLVPPVQLRMTGRQVWLRVEDSIGITPTSAPRFH